MKTPCPNQFEGCPEPFADAHHIYKEADADTQLRRIFCNLGAHSIQLCRCVHRELEAQGGWLPYPDEGVMVDIINSEVKAGNTTLSRTKTRRLGL